MGLLDGKKGLILNIANGRSIATHIADNCVKQGARCGFGFLPMDNIEKSQRRVKKAMEEFGFPNEWLHPCDVGSDESMDKFFAAAKERSILAACHQPALTYNVERSMLCV